MSIGQTRLIRIIHNPLIIGVLLSFLLTLIFCSWIFSSISKPLGENHGDAYFSNFILNHVTKTLFSGTEKLTDTGMFYGFKNSLFFSDSYITQGLPGLIISPFVSNPLSHFYLTGFITLVLSFFSIFIFLHYLTKNIPASIAGSIIFTFNPYVMIRFPDHLHIYSLQFIPFTFLLNLKLLLKK